MQEELQVMAEGKVVAIFIAQAAGSPMRKMEEVKVLAGYGLEGDRYAAGQGSFNQGKQGNRQVTLINSQFFAGTVFEYSQTRRNIITRGTELMWLIGREFDIGTARMRGIKYCDPCDRPSKLAKHKASFREHFQDCGGLIAEVIRDGIIKTNDLIIPPPKGY